MLNYETLLSSYDDRLTLMQWLKKVEGALKDASAVSFNVNDSGDARYSFSVVFEDGSEIESNPISLPSVENAYIQNGHLHIVLTSGDDLDVGNMFNGDVTLTGNFTATGNIASGNAVSTPALTSENESIEAQKPVIEVMDGYSAYITSEMDTWDKNISYIGACKNGNKLTFVICGKLTRLSTTSVLMPDIVRFSLPPSVASKLIPIQISAYSYLDQKVIPAFYGPTQYINCPMRVSKAGNQITMVGTFSDLEINTEYVIRYEATFLLSENLAE